MTDLENHEIELFLEGIPEVCFLTGTGTDVGKSYAAGWLARSLRERGVKSITQKFVQTGNKTESEDIALHRQIMGIEPEPADLLHITAPVIFTYPCSPHLAARIDGREIDFGIIEQATAALRSQYPQVIIEGAGGVMVPLTEDYLTLDYILDHKLPSIVVVGGVLGSINHALLTLELMRLKGAEIYGVVYNPWFDKDKTIAAETRSYLRKWVASHMPDTRFCVMPEKV